MESLEIRSVSVANLPDLVAPCMMAGTLGSGMTIPTESAEAMTRSKLAFFHDRIARGAAAKVAYKDGRPAGVLEYYPIEAAPAPVIGNDLFVINCLQVPQRELREEIEKELVAACVKDWSSRKGVVVLGRGKAWDKLGFEEVTEDAWPEGGELILWLMKFWEVEEPRLAPVNREFATFRGKVRVDLFESGFCPWDHYVNSLVTQVAEEFGSAVLLDRVDCNDRKSVLAHGLTAGVALNGDFQAWLRPHPIPTIAQIRDKIEELL
jgi:hypothetical protein